MSLVKEHQRHPDSLETFQIFVNGLCGKTIALRVHCTTKIRSIKNMIATKAFVPCNEQCLMYRCKPLEDRYTLAEYGVHKYSTLELFCRLLGGLTVSIRLSSDKIITLTLPSEATVTQAKDKISAYENLDKRFMKLCVNGVEVEDNSAISEICVKNGFVDCIVKFEIFIIKDDRKTFFGPVEVSPFQLILEFKKNIEETFGVPCDQQILKFQGKILNENETIKSVGVGADHCVLLTIINEKHIDFQEDQQPSTSMKLKLECSTAVEDSEEERWLAEHFYSRFNLKNKQKVFTSNRRRLRDENSSGSSSGLISSSRSTESTNISSFSEHD